MESLGALGNLSPEPKAVARIHADTGGLYADRSSWRYHAMHNEPGR